MLHAAAYALRTAAEPRVNCGGMLRLTPLETRLPAPMPFLQGAL
jgi:hypothetical protein